MPHQHFNCRRCGHCCLHLVDAYRGKVAEHDFLKYCFFVLFFPQLIAGPIVRYAEIKDQLTERVITANRLAVGATRFLHGLAKKVIIADSVAPIADAAFASGDLRPTLAAWIGLLAYTVQI